MTFGYLRKPTRRVVVSIIIFMTIFFLISALIPRVRAWTLLQEFVPPFWGAEVSKDPDIPRNQAVMNAETGRGAILAKPQIGESAYARAGVVEPFVYTGKTQEGLIDVSLTLDKGMVYRAPEASGGSVSVCIELYEWLPPNEYETFYWIYIWKQIRTYITDVSVFGRLDGFTWNKNHIYRIKVKVLAYASCGWSPETISYAHCDDIRIHSIRMWGDVPPCGNNPPPPPRCFLNIDYAWIGQEVTISGEGFAADDQIDILFDGVKLKDTTSSSNGDFTTTFEVPEAPKNIMHVVKAIDTQGNSVDNPLTIVEDYNHPALIYVSRSLTSPDIIQLRIQGTNFSPNSKVNVTYAGSLKIVDTSNDEGDFLTFFNIPSSEIGYLVEAVDEKMRVAAKLALGGDGSVGGIVVPVNKPALLALYIGVVSAIFVSTAATAIYVKRVKYRKEEMKIGKKSQNDFSKDTND